jgi:phage replication O-like protein O
MAKTSILGIKKPFLGTTNGKNRDHRVPTPQLEDGYLDAIIRKTYGWNKKQDRISYSQMASMTGLKRENVIRAMKKLVHMQIVIKNDSSRTNSYMLNKNYMQWDKSSIKTDTSPTGYQKRYQKGIKTDTKKGIKSDTHKRHKDNRTKYNENSVEFSLTQFCVKRILKNHPHLKFKSNDIAKFHDMFNKLIRIDGYRSEQIREVIDWVTSQTETRNGFCWAAQFMSPMKLRKRNRDGIRFIDVWISESNGKFVKSDSGVAQFDRLPNSSR